MSLDFILYDMAPATVFVIAFIEFLRMMHKETSQSAREERIRHLAVRSVRAHRRAKTVTRAAVAAPPKCQHPEVVDVENSGEVVARLCLDPECWEQLPADFEPRPTYGWGDFGAARRELEAKINSAEVYEAALPLLDPTKASNRTPLILSSTPPPSNHIGQIWHEVEEKHQPTKVWSGDYWEAVSQQDAALERLQRLEERAKELTRKIEQQRVGREAVQKPVWLVDREGESQWDWGLPQTDQPM